MTDEIVDEVRRGRPPKAEMFPVRLLKNYKPVGAVEIVGDAPEPPFPGTGQEGKLWAGTVVKLPIDEARRLMEHTVSTIEKSKDDLGRPIARRVERSQPLAERADALPI